MPPQELIELPTLGLAPNLHLGELAESTSSVFNLLRPWCLAENTSSSLFRAIQNQACEYVKAVDLSITAAQSGFTFCDEVLAFAELLDSTTDKQRQDYLRDMHTLARRGVENAGMAHSCFRDVRMTIEQLLKNARARAIKSSSDQAKLDEFERSITALEHFSSCIQLYISNWNWIYMEQKSQEDRQGMLVDKYNTIRQQGVLDTWKTLRREYASYTCTIRFIQDKNPDFWRKIRNPANADPSMFQGLRNLKLWFISK